MNSTKTAQGHDQSSLRARMLAGRISVSGESAAAKLSRTAFQLPEMDKRPQKLNNFQPRDLKFISSSGFYREVPFCFWFLGIGFLRDCFFRMAFPYRFG
jgi:hypothetical protein